MATVHEFRLDAMPRLASVAPADDSLPHVPPFVEQPVPAFRAPDLSEVPRILKIGRMDRQALARLIRHLESL